MGPIPKVALPPVTAQYASTLQPAGVQAPAAPSPYTFSRASDGKTRVDSGNLSVISNPAAGQTIVLDHLKKTATIQPMPAPAPPSPATPQMPGFGAPSVPGQPNVPGLKMEDLGKAMLQGHEVAGMRMIIPPVSPPTPAAFGMPGAPKMPGMPAAPGAPQMPGIAVPKLPQIPGMPGAPKVPGIPSIPGMPGVPGMPRMPGMPTAGAKTPQMPGAPTAPATPQAPAMAEIWSSTSMAVPMLTKVSGSFGQLTQVCHSVVPAEPHPSAFQIPQGYKVSGVG